MRVGVQGRGDHGQIAPLMVFVLVIGLVAVVVIGRLVLIADDSARARTAVLSSPTPRREVWSRWSSSEMPRPALGRRSRSTGSRDRSKLQPSEGDHEWGQDERGQSHEEGTLQPPGGRRIRQQRLPR